MSTAAACIPSTDALSAPAALRRGVGSGALLKISAISRNAASASWARLHDNEQVLLLLPLAAHLLQACCPPLQAFSIILLQAQVLQGLLHIL